LAIPSACLSFSLVCVVLFLQTIIIRRQLLFCPCLSNCALLIVSAMQETMPRGLQLSTDIKMADSFAMTSIENSTIEGSVVLDGFPWDSLLEPRLIVNDYITGVDQDS
jgi:hypothetical protein